MDRSKNIESFKRSKHKHRSGGSGNNLNLDDYVHQMNNTSHKKSKHSRNKPLTLKHKSSWFTKSNSHSASPQHHTITSRDSTHSIHSPTNSSYGYIQSLPTSSSNHGWIYHPQYGMILFTYNQALETARSHKQINRNYSGYMSESESYNDHTANHLDLPSDLPGKSTHHSRSPSPYRKYSGYTSRSRSPSPSPIPMSTNNNSSNTDYGLSDINRLYVYQPVKFELGKQKDNKSDEQMHSPICNLSEYEDNNTDNEMIVEIEYDVIAKGLNWRNNNINNSINNSTNSNIKTDQMEMKEKKMNKKHKKTSFKHSKRVFNDGDDTESECENDIKSQRISRKSRYSQQKYIAKTKTKLGPRPTKPVPLPPKKINNKKKHHKNGKKRHNKKPKKALVLDLSDIENNNNNISVTDDIPCKSPKLQLSISHSNTLLRSKSRNHSSQRIAMNVKVLNSIQNNDCNIYCFSPRGKHYTPIQLKQNNNNNIIKSNDNILDIRNRKNTKYKNNKIKKEKHVLYEIDLKPSSKIISNNNNEIKMENIAIENKSNNKLKMPKFPRLRKKSSSDALHEWVNSNSKNNKLLTPFCPSMNQYYVKDACLLHWEGKQMDEIKQHGVKKCMTKKLFSDNCNDKVGENVFFSMTNDIDKISDELEEKINRLFNNNGGTIYIGIKSKKDKRNKNMLSVAKGGRIHNKSSSFTFTKGNILNKSKKDITVIENDNNNVAKSPIASVRNHVIVGIKVNSKMRYKLRNVIVDDIIKGFIPQVPHLLQNFDLKFIPVISQNGKILKRCFVIKISVVAPIFGVNGDAIQFRTKDGYAHVVDF